MRLPEWGRRAAVYLGVFSIGGLFWAAAPLMRPARKAPVPLPTSLVRPAFDAALADKSVRFFEERERRDPAGATSIAMLADAYLRRFREQGDSDDLIRAEQAARRSLKARAYNNAGAYLALARALMSQHRFAEAIAAVENPAARIGDPTGAEYLAAECRMEIGDYKAAGDLLAKAALRYPDDPNGMTLRARLAEIRGLSDRALELYRTAAQTAEAKPETPRPTLAWFHGRVGECLASRGRMAEAENAYRAALEAWDRDWHAMIGLARLFAVQGKTESAKDWAEQANRIVPTQEAAMLLYNLYRAEGNTTEAERQFRWITEGGSALHAHTRALALFYADHDFLPNDALTLMQAERASRKDVYTADALAWVCFKTGRLDEADALVQEALAQGTQDARMHYHAGRIAEARGDIVLARRHLETALMLNPFFDMKASEEARDLLHRLHNGTTPVAVGGQTP